MNNIDKWIEKSWRKTGFDFLKNHRAILWTESAALKFPFFLHLERLRYKYNIDRSLVIVPEYCPTTPDNAKKHHNDYPKCVCKSDKFHGKSNMKIDLCIVKFNNPVDIPYPYPSDEWRNMWCFNPQPTVAMEFKYLSEFNKQSLKDDIFKLNLMINNHKTKICYLCFVVNQNPTNSNLKSLWELIDIKEKFRLAIGTYKLNEWKIVS